MKNNIYRREKSFFKPRQAPRAFFERLLGRGEGARSRYTRSRRGGQTRVERLVPALQKPNGTVASRAGEGAPWIT